MDNENNCSQERRKFLGKSASLIGLTVLGSSFAGAFLQSCETDTVKSTTAGVTKTLDITPYLKINPLSKYPFINLKNIGCGIIKRFPDVNYGIPLLVIKINEHEETVDGTLTKVPDFVVYSSMCTHNNCIGSEDIANSKVLPSIGSKDENRLIKCGCHGSMYDAFDNARVVKGPAEKPLKMYKNSYDPLTKVLSIYF